VQITQDGKRRDFLQSRIFRQWDDGTNEDGAVIYRGELHSDADFGKLKNKALDSCFDHFKKHR
jgi:hypothetical protein